jgi:PAS domain S-box-containing protein
MPEATVEMLTERIRALEQENRLLTQSAKQVPGLKRYLLEILDNTPAPIYMKDSDFRYIFINKQFEINAHISLKDIDGRLDSDIFPEQMAMLFRSQDEEVKRQNRSLEFEETVSLPDGEFTFITLKFPIHDAEGKILGVAGFCTDISERKKIEEEKLLLITKLQKTLDEVKTLRGIIPICAYCKNIRDDKGYWTQVEAYVTQHTGADFTHGYCPECMERHFPGVAAEPTDNQ